MPTSEGVYRQLVVWLFGEPSAFVLLVSASALVLLVLPFSSALVPVLVALPPLDFPRELLVLSCSCALFLCLLAHPKPQAASHNEARSSRFQVPSQNSEVAGSRSELGTSKSE